MNNNGINKRRHPRVYFKAANMLTMHIVHPLLNETPFIVKVMNMSESGLGFLMPKGSDIKINIGDPLICEKIEDVQILKVIIKVDMIVRWSFQEKEFDHQIFGCEFLNLPSNYNIYLRTFIRQQTSGSSLNPKIGSPNFDA